MDNNDRLIRIRYALDIKDTDMVKIFELGGLKVTVEEVKLILKKTSDQFFTQGEMEEEEVSILISDQILTIFLNGLITFKRGVKKTKPGEKPEQLVKQIVFSDLPAMSVKEYLDGTGEIINNDMLKKLKIALSLTADDVREIIISAGVDVSKGELGAIFRNKSHKNYKVCGDKYARSFLKGVTEKYRKL